MLKKIEFSVVMTLAVMTLPFARPQETATEDLEDILQQNAMSNAIDSLASVIDTGLQYGEDTAGYEGLGTETTTMADVLESATESNGSSTEIFSRESQQLLNHLSSPHPNFEDSSSLPTLNASPFYAEEASPLPSPYYVAAPSPPMQDVSQPLYPAHGASPLFPFAIPTFERNQTLLTGNQTNSPIGSLWQLLNHSQKGNAMAGGAGSGSVQNNSAIAEGKGIANVGFGGFGIGLGIGGAIQTPLGSLAFGQGNGIAIG